MNATIPGLFRLTGEDGDDLNIILPQPLVEDLAQARTLINEAILEANRATRQGFDGGYFEELQGRLAKHGIQTLAEIDNLQTWSWDGNCNDELGDMVADTTPEGLVQVVVSNISEVFEHQDEELLLCTLAGGDPAIEYSIDPDMAEKIHVVSMSVEFPRSDRYGVPDCSTDRGGRQYLRDLGLRVPSSVTVEAEDSGDDTPTQISLVCRVPREILVPVLADSDSTVAPEETPGS